MVSANGDEFEEGLLGVDFEEDQGVLELVVYEQSLRGIARPVLGLVFLRNQFFLFALDGQSAVRKSKKPTFGFERCFEARK